VATPQAASDNDHALLLMLAVLHGLARFVDEPEYRPDVDLVAREWPPAQPAEGSSVAPDASQGIAPDGARLRRP
jgi:hypothetical protein